MDGELLSASGGRARKYECVSFTALFTKQPLALQTAYSELKRHTLEQRSLFIGTPGSVVVRTVSGRRFFYRDHYAPDGKKAVD